MDLRKKKVVATLVFSIKESAVLLARKTRKIGVGLWNGWGGEVEEGETIRQAALREFTGESGLSAKAEDLEYAGKITFHNQKGDGRKFDVEVYMFLLKNWSGEPRPNLAEMVEPTLWPILNLPYNEMMPSDKDWMPHILAGERIEAEVWHGLDQKTIIRPTEIRKAERISDVD